MQSAHGLKESAHRANFFVYIHFQNARMKGRCQCATSKENGLERRLLYAGRTAIKPLQTLNEISVILPIYAANARNTRTETAPALAFFTRKSLCKTKSAVHTRKGVASVQPVKAWNSRPGR